MANETGKPSQSPSSPDLTGVIATEQVNPRTVDVDRWDTQRILYALNDEDATVAHAVRQAIPQIALVVDWIAAAFGAGGRLFYVGAGTSGRMGVLDASECPPTFGAEPAQVQGIIAGGERALRHAIEGAEDSADAGQSDLLAAGVRSGDVVVGLSASGQAPYVLAALQTARVQGCKTALVTCNPQASTDTPDATHQPILIPVGPEAIAGSSRLKAGTAQKLVLNMLSTTAFVRIGKTYENLMVDVKPTNRKLRARAVRIVAALGSVSREQAEALLGQTHYAVKPAVVMARTGLSPDDAQARLDASHGRLRDALE